MTIAQNTVGNNSFKQVTYIVAYKFKCIYLEWTCAPIIGNFFSRAVNSMGFCLAISFSRVNSIQIGKLATICILTKNSLESLIEALSLGWFCVFQHRGGHVCYKQPTFHLATFDIRKELACSWRVKRIIVVDQTGSLVHRSGISKHRLRAQGRSNHVASLLETCTSIRRIG